MEEVGALLGRYHVAVRQMQMTCPAPCRAPTGGRAAGPAGVSRLDVIPPEQGSLLFASSQVQLVRDLDDAGHPGTHGNSRRFHQRQRDRAAACARAPSGVIDFALAHVETPLADIGYGLWRSGRSS